MDFFRHLLFILPLIGYASGFDSKKCPISCYCSIINNGPNIKVTCRTGFWKRIPGINEHTTELYVKDSDIEVMQEPPECVNYEGLVTLSVTYSKVTEISNRAFRCFNNLIKLDLTGNRLRSLNPRAMKHLPSLQHLNMNRNPLTSRIFSILCQLKSIESVSLSQSKLHLNERSLKCMGDLKNLINIRLSGNYFNGSFRNVMWPLRNISSLEASSCGIKNLTEDTFDGFNITSITLRNNSIKEIRKNTFSHLTNLKRLHFGENPLNGSHKWISTLKMIGDLDIGNIGLSEIPALPKYVKNLSLVRNKIQTLKNQSFCNFPQLRSISLSLAHIKEVEAMSFCELPKLDTLILKTNRIHGRHLMNLLLTLANSSLQLLDLDSNPIKSLNKKIFEAFQPNSLQTLYLRECQIEGIESETFTHLSALVRLVLSKNGLHKLERNTFKGLHSLTSLKLDNNRLYDFRGEFNGIQGSPLKHLTLANNVIKSFTSTTLKGLDNLENLDLRRNAFTVIKRKLFQNMPSLSSLSMESCRLTSIQNGAFSNLQNLTTLSLSENRFVLEHSFPSNFQHMTKLKKLDLSATLIGNQGKAQIQSIWLKSPNLKVLSLSDCRILKLLPGMFSSLRHLKQLFLNTNYISFIEPTAFKNTGELEELQVNSNRITSVNWISFMYLPYLRTLSLKGNHLVCTCDILWFVQTIQSQQIYIPQWYNYYCTPPGQHKQRRLHIKVLDCEEPWVAMLKPIAIAFACVGVNIVLIYVVRHYQWHIRYTFFLAKAGIYRYREMKDEEQYEYDAFVAYHSDDLPWVEHQFLHNVDREYLNDKGYSLCIHHRDWLGGEYIADNIRKSVIASRKTIIVLSKSFATSHWCRFELEMARANIDAKGRGDSQLVVILLESIPEELLNPHLVHILTTKTYISWPKDPAMHPRFWKAVRKSLKKGLLYNVSAL